MNGNEKGFTLPELAFAILGIGFFVGGWVAMHFILKFW